MTRDIRPSHTDPVEEIPSGDVKRLLDDLQRGKPVSEEIFRRVYDELHALARYHRRNWKGNETLNTTAIVHEAYIKLVGKGIAYEGRKHFMVVASKAMRHLLISYAERMSAAKRGGNQEDLPLDEAILAPEESTEDLLALNEALVRLESLDPRAARIIECRFFGGMDAEETADALGISRRTVSRDWKAARAWLYAEMNRVPPEANPGETRPVPDD